MLRTLVLLGLAGLWAVVLVPPALRALSRFGRSSDSVGSFRNNMTVLGGATPAGRVGRTPLGAPAPTVGSRPRTRAEVRKRRRDVLVGLLAVSGLLLVVAVVVGGAAWMAWLVSAGLLAGYVALLVQLKAAAAEREVKVAFLPSGAAPDVVHLEDRDERALRRVSS